MKKPSLVLKVFTLISLSILMLVPVAMIMGLIDERHDYQLSVIGNISESMGGRQIIAGPIIIQPYIQQHKSIDDKKKVTVHETYHNHYILPDQLDVHASLAVDKRYLGIYHANVYQGKIQFEGKLPALAIAELANKEGVKLLKPYAVVSVSDPRGITNLSQFSLSWEDKIIRTGEKQEQNISSAFVAGVADSPFHKGVHAEIPEMLMLSKTPVDFKFNINLQGSQSFSVVPLGKQTELNMDSNWPHPNFLGQYLPATKAITEKGFTATWKSSWFANNINELFEHYERMKNYKGVKSPSNKMSLKSLPAFDIKLIDVVDEYQLNERSVKYSVLFIGLTFIGFFLFEVLKKLRIHPIQYLLVGVALALFYLILLALSEHIGFNMAYIIAASACCGLITFYLIAVLKGIMRGLSFGLGILVLYAVLFALLQSENNSLLLGSGLLFAVVAIMMLLTRKVDWYELSVSMPEINCNVKSEPKPAQPSTSGFVPEEKCEPVPEVKADAELVLDTESAQNPEYVGGSIAEDDAHKEIVDDITRKDCRLWK